jgi:hypothetical protein
MDSAIAFMGAEGQNPQDASLFDVEPLRGPGALVTKKALTQGRRQERFGLAIVFCPLGLGEFSYNASRSGLYLSRNE